MGTWFKLSLCCYFAVYHSSNVGPQWLSFNTYFPTEQFGVEGTEESEDCKNDLPDVSSKSLCHESDYRR